MAGMKVGAVVDHLCEFYYPGEVLHSLVPLFGKLVNEQKLKKELWRLVAEFDATSQEMLARLLTGDTDMFDDSVGKIDPLKLTGGNVHLHVDKWEFLTLIGTEPDYTARPLVASEYGGLLARLLVSAYYGHRLRLFLKFLGADAPSKYSNIYQSIREHVSPEWYRHAVQTYLPQGYAPKSFPKVGVSAFGVTDEEYRKVYPKRVKLLDRLRLVRASRGRLTKVRLAYDQVIWLLNETGTWGGEIAEKYDDVLDISAVVDAHESTPLSLEAVMMAAKQVEL
jgi:hypothetical protein